MLRKDGQSLGCFHGQQCPSDVGINVEVVSVCQCTKGECDREFPDGAHGGSVDGSRGDGRQ